MGSTQKAGDVKLAHGVPLALMAACSGSAPATPAIPDWAVAATPSFTIGTSEAEPGHELSRVGFPAPDGWLDGTPFCGR